MAHPFPSQAWTQAFKDALNSNPDYAEAGKEWTHGPVLMVVAPDESRGITKPMGMLIDVHAGTCREAVYDEADVLRDRASFVIEADFDRWKSVLRGEVDPIKAMMQGLLRLTKGHLPTIIKYVQSSRQLVVSAQHVPTRFPEDA